MFQLEDDHFMQLLEEVLQPSLCEEHIEKLAVFCSEGFFIGWADLCKRILECTVKRKKLIQ